MAMSAIRATAGAPRPARDRSEFAPGGEFTVGAEEELFVLDEQGRFAPALGQELVERIGAAVPHPGARVTAELFAAEVEFATTVCTDADQIVGQLAALRSAVLAGGAEALACGVHPAGAFADAALTPAARYHRIGDSLAGLLRTPTAAFQVHVGVPDERAALLAYRGIRHHLPVLQALAAGSPFWHGRDSGMASARWAVISSYPRGGVPPIAHSWEEYAALVDLVVHAARVPDYTHLWWDARLQPRLGTLEIRVLDAQPSLAAAAGLAALAQGLVRYAVENPVAFDVPGAVLAENSFRAARHGLETTLVDVDGRHRPVRELATHLVGAARDVLAPDGLAEPLSAVEQLLAEETGPARQRRLYATGGICAVVADLVERTALGC
jgi:carboxylate-amine ligase